MMCTAGTTRWCQDITKWSLRHSLSFYFAKKSSMTKILKGVSLGLGHDVESVAVLEGWASNIQERAMLR